MRALEEAEAKAKADKHAQMRTFEDEAGYPKGSWWKAQREDPQLVKWLEMRERKWVESKEPNRFYVYVISCTEGIVRYVGKGSATRWMQSMCKHQLNKLGELNVQILFQNTEQCAFDLEAQLIRKHTTPFLLNLEGRSPEAVEQT